MTGITKYERVCQPLVAVVACGLNIPPMILGLIASVHWCPYFGRFLAPNAVFCFVNMAAAFFSIYQLRIKVEFDRQRNDEDGEDDNGFGKSSSTNAQTALPNVDEGTNQIKNKGEEPVTITAIHPSNNVDSSTPTPSTQQIEIAEDIKEADEGAVHNINLTHSCFRRCLQLRTTSSNRIHHLVCYNGFVTTYSILFLFWAFWLGSGDQIASASDNVSDQRQEGCSDQDFAIQNHYVTISVFVGYAYIAFLAFCLVASYCDPE